MTDVLLGLAVIGASIALKLQNTCFPQGAVGPRWAELAVCNSYVLEQSRRPFLRASFCTLEQY